MKILFLISSYRKNGNTTRMVQSLEESMKSLSLKFNTTLNSEIIFLGHQNILTCKGCRVCFDRGEMNCPLKDDLLLIKQKFDNADCIVTASPVYVEDVNGIMKNWIDRMAFICHRPEYAGKLGYILSTSGAGSTNHTLVTMGNALRLWGVRIIGQSTFKMNALMDKEEMNSLYHKNINKIAKKILKSYDSGKGLKPSFFSLLMFKIQQLSYQKANDKASIDFQYWKNNGWLEKGCVYYAKNKSNFLKVFFARFIGRIIAKILLKI